MTDVTFTFRLEQPLKDAFASMAEAQDLSAAQLLRKMMREAVERHQEELAHQRWLEREIRDAMHETGKPRSARLSNEAITEEWQREKGGISRGDDA